MITKVVCFLLLGILVHEGLSAVLRDAPSQCGYQSCNPLKEGFINVHLVPHTHDDVGWLKTVDQYFYGSNSSIQRAGVQYILDSVVDELSKDPSRRFIYVETAFFWKWWIHQNDATRHKVKQYVSNGQLEFIGGGWSMNDEAATHYHSTIDQFTWGLRKLNDSFGDCGRPRIGWQIDPFGHSREMASIFAQLGFDAVLLGRIDYQDKAARFSGQTAEVVWQGSSSLGETSQIFTGVMYNTYGPPPGFCWDIMCDDEQLVDDAKSPLYNIDRKVDAFFDYLNNASKVYTTNNIILTMGEDFHYQNANSWFKNLDILIHYANLRQKDGSKYNLIYSTPSCYVKAVHDEAATKKWPLKTDDFFPYASDPHSFWTGYFISRPTLKRFEREGNNFLQVCKQLYALTDLGPEDRVDLNSLREAMGIMQHHDAVTGTEKQHVADDYARILKKGFDECEIITSAALNKIIAKDPVGLGPIQSCLLTNVSSCPFTETHESFVVTVYNPLSRPVTKYVRLPVTGTAYTVTDPAGIRALTEIIPIADAILKIPGRVSEANLELIFAATDVPPLGFKSYYVQKQSGDEVVKEETVTKVENKQVGFEVDQMTGLLVAVTMNGKHIDIGQDFLYYEGFVGDNREFANRSSGAYIFRPTSSDATKLSQIATFKVFRGELVSEMHQTFNDWATQIIRIYNTENYIEFDWLIGPIPQDQANGKEVISRFTTTLNSNSIFFTDSNGREMLKRVRNFRPNWNLTLEEPVSGNYYPVTSKIVLVDEVENLEVAVLNDRAQGGTSMKDGEIEIMVHRSCLHDDAFGVGEALNETAFGEGLVARGSHYLVVGPLTSDAGDVSTAAQERDIAQRKLLAAWTFLSSTNGLSYEEYKAKFALEYSGLKRALPNNVQILTLEPWKGFSFLLRLEHVLEISEDATLSKPIDVDLKDLFSPFEILSIKETTLAANQWLEDNSRLHFDTGDDLEKLLHGNISTNDPWIMNYRKNNGFIKRATVIDAHDYRDDFLITLTPMQIKTFVIDIKKN